MLIMGEAEEANAQRKEAARKELNKFYDYKSWFSPVELDSISELALVVEFKGVGAIKNGDGPGAALKAMMRYGSDDVIPPGVA